MRKKILFCQAFSLQQPGGGASILKKLISYSNENNFSCDVCFDEREVPSEYITKAVANGEAPIETRSRNAFNQRFHFLIPILIVLGFDSVAKKSFRKYLSSVNPDVIHITAHGLTFPLFFQIARQWKRSKVVVSIHDLWHTTLYTPVPKWIVEKVFKSCLKAADVVYVISEEMGEYVKAQYGVQQYYVIHDGYENGTNKKVTTQNRKRNSFLYVGIMTDHQLALTEKIIDAMGSMKDEFVIGVCSTRELKPSKHYNNIAIHNYGWVNEEQLKTLSESYGFGLLPTSFDASVQLFYRTSLMTKVPFYFQCALPVFCIGEANYAAVHLIQKEEAGVVCFSEKQEEIETSLRTILSMPGNDYAALTNNCLQSIQTTFNAKLICERFYQSLN
jgi:glycosyltransferase involved in cell wall biosynthesis